MGGMQHLRIGTLTWSTSTIPYAFIVLAVTCVCVCKLFVHTHVQLIRLCMSTQRRPKPTSSPPTSEPVEITISSLSAPAGKVMRWMTGVLIAWRLSASNTRRDACRRLTACVLSRSTMGSDVLSAPSTSSLSVPSSSTARRLQPCLCAKARTHGTLVRSDYRRLAPVAGSSVNSCPSRHHAMQLHSCVKSDCNKFQGQHNLQPESEP